jgi:hypothetical protein
MKKILVLVITIAHIFSFQFPVKNHPLRKTERKQRCGNYRTNRQCSDFLDTETGAWFMEETNQWDLSQIADVMRNTSNTNKITWGPKKHIGFAFYGDFCFIYNNNCVIKCLFKASVLTWSTLPGVVAYSLHQQVLQQPTINYSNHSAHSSTILKS